MEWTMVDHCLTAIITISFVNEMAQVMSSDVIRDIMRTISIRKIKTED